MMVGSEVMRHSRKRPEGHRSPSAIELHPGDSHLAIQATLPHCRCKGPLSFERSHPSTRELSNVHPRKSLDGQVAASKSRETSFAAPKHSRASSIGRG